MGDIQREAIKQGYSTLSFVGRRKVYRDIPCEKIGNPISFWIHVMITTVFDRQGYGSYFCTRKLIKRLRQEKPDVIHLHNLHGYYLNLPLLFDYLKNEFQGKLFWTFHDCWPFTGHCPYFTIAECDKWKTECGHCPNKRKYPISLFLDGSTKNFYDKQAMFTGLNNLTIITPSEWLKQLVMQSFMREYPVKVVPNGIDLRTFSYCRRKEVEKKYHIPDNKKIILGVAAIWEERKGLNDFLMLASCIDEEYSIVLVGVTESQKKRMPHNIITIGRTENREELVAIYSRADVFVNPSREETFSMVTLESFACGTPVVVLDTSAVKDLVTEDNGIVLQGQDMADYISAIAELENRKLTREQVAKTAGRYDNQLVNLEIVEQYG